MAFFLKRTLHRWHILLTLALGVILATAMLVSGPLLVDAVMNFALPYKLRDPDPLTNNLRITTHAEVEQNDYQSLDDQLRAIFSQRLGSHIDQVNGIGVSGWGYPWVNGQLSRDQRIAISSYEKFPDNIKLIAGGWPSGPALQNNVLQVVVSEEFAQAYGLQVGDQLPLSRTLTENNPSYWLSIGGIAIPTDPRSAYWFGQYSPMQNQAADRWTSQFNVFVPEEQFLAVSEQLYPSLRRMLSWNVLIDPASFRVGDISPTRTQINLLRGDLKELPNSFSIETKLDQTLLKFTAQEKIVRITMYVLIAEILLLALYYVSMMSSISTQLTEGETSTLSSRGASYSQLFQIQASDALIISAASLVIGPILAMLMVWCLSKYGPLADIALADWSFSMTPTAWAAAMVSVIVCILGMVLPIRSAAKRSVVAYSRSISRADRPPWWQRVYLDVFILVTALVLLWRMRFYGSLASSTGAGRVDWLLILSPLVLLLGTATIMLRVFPPVLRTISRITARGKGITTPLAFLQTSRSPAHVARLVLLLTLTMAMGILASGINATLNGSEYERTFYATGSDLRLKFSGLLPIHDLNRTPGVNATSVVWRGAGSSNVRIHDVIPTFDVLAIEPYSFSHVTRYRPDYSEQPMGELLGKLASDVDPKGGNLIPLPGKPGHLGLWIYDWTLQNPADPTGDQLLDNLMINAKLQTADNQVIMVRLISVTPDTPSEDPQWVYFNAVVPELSPESYPLSFHSFWYTSSRTLESQAPINLLLDDLSVIDSGSGETHIFEDFEVIKRIWNTNSPNSPIYFSKSLPTHSGDASLLLILPMQVNTSGYALMPVSTDRDNPLSALFSKELLTLTEIKVGDTFIGNIQGRRMPIKVIGSIEYFPTLYDKPGRGFMIVPRDELLYKINMNDRMPANPNEIWIDTQDEQISNQIKGGFSNALQVWEFGTERRILKADGLTLGLRSATFLAYLLTTVLSLVGFATYFYMSARQREMQFGILRSLGMSPGQLYGWLLLEQVIMILAGLTLGTIFGMMLNKLILPGLPISFGDRPAIPPFLPLENWNAVFTLYLILLIAFLATLGIATGLLWRSNLHRAIKIGQE